ncbi:hypothetical protein KAFR_0C06460 [Kazachstania africana CBS 2517]|uniref:Pre-mRNA-splicing factor CWC22 n=1 Tax=Kazachstania africana (strain ATCC 22294 / BCRC 22015 / CBS 2517 / CECT 1963 / NBRC 1671 / NRRL Y-8276) TaxID=1071382 RepID=H2ATE2_KAZAF|nr:hypothetical protein KAFR_0C06460 [Kazachstania africana CBS 2517]CCF57642.1 hypothetical protein KAFR_0C06460 [Kazachstania africana CBS 2517]
MKSEEYSEEVQRKNWEEIRVNTRKVLKNLGKEPLLVSYANIFEANIVIGEPILATEIYESMSISNIKDLSPLLKLLDVDLPDVAKEVTRQIIISFIDDIKNQREKQCLLYTTALSSFLSYGIIHELIILQLVHVLLSEKTSTHKEFNINVLINLLLKSGKALQRVSKIPHDSIFEDLRSMLQSGQVPVSLTAKLEILFDLRRKNYKMYDEEALVDLPPFVPGESDNEVVFLLDDDSLKSPILNDSFRQVENYETLQKQFILLKEKVQTRLSSLSVPQSSQSVTVVHDMTQAKDVEFKKKIYLIMKSSLSGDEAAHKILKLRIPDDEKHKIVDILVNSELQERTFSKFYAILAERLCSNHRSWASAFEVIFAKFYLEMIDTIEPAKLRIMGKFWASLLSADFLGLEILKIIKLTENETTPPIRIFIKFLFQELVLKLGLKELKDRINEPFVKPSLLGLFPEEDLENMRYAINFFTAINLGVLTDDMRKKLTIIELDQEVSQQATEEELPEETESPAKIQEQEVRNERPSRYGPHRTSPRPGRRRSITPPRRRNHARNRARTPPRQGNAKRSRYKN